MDGTAGAAMACAATFNTMAGGQYNATCLVMINGGNPGQVHSFAGDLESLLRTLSGLLGQLRQQQSNLMQVWTSAKSAPAAADKLTKAFATFQQAIGAIDKFTKALHAAADLVDKAMTGANTAVKQHDPPIGQLLASQQPAARALARALAAIMDSGVSAFLQGQSGALTGSAGTISSGTSNPLGTILQAIGSAINGTSATPTTAATTTLPTAPVTLPTTAVSLPATSLPAAPVSIAPVTSAPASIAPASIAPVTNAPIDSTVPGASQSYPYGYPTGTGTGFVPVDPAPTHHVEVDFGANGDLVAVKSDIDANVDVVLRNADGTQVERMVHVKSDGTTTTV
jgi:uncharacterized protein YukE